MRKDPNLDQDFTEEERAKALSTIRFYKRLQTTKQIPNIKTSSQQQILSIDQTLAQGIETGEYSHVARFIERYKHYLFKKDNVHDTHVHLALSLKFYNLAKFLIHQGASNRNCETLLECAFKEEDVQLCEILTSKELNLPDNRLGKMKEYVEKYRHTHKFTYPTNAFTTSYLHKPSGVQSFLGGIFKLGAEKHESTKSTPTLYKRDK